MSTRISAQAKAVLNVLAEKRCHLTAEEILASLDHIGTATVYRALDHLTELGMPMKIRGFKYNVSAIALAVADPDITDAVISRLYPEVAKIHNTTPSKVERSMRHAIEVAWSRCDLDVTYRHFGNSVNPNKGKPTNSEFVARMAQVIRDCV